jgi:hypothetical protein
MKKLLKKFLLVSILAGSIETNAFVPIPLIPLAISAGISAGKFALDSELGQAFKGKIGNLVGDMVDDKIADLVDTVSSAFGIKQSGPSAAFKAALLAASKESSGSNLVLLSFAILKDPQLKKAFAALGDQSLNTEEAIDAIANLHSYYGLIARVAMPNGIPGPVRREILRTIEGIKPEDIKDSKALRKVVDYVRSGDRLETVSKTTSAIVNGDLDALKLISEEFRRIIDQFISPKGKNDLENTTDFLAEKLDY